MPKLGSSTLIYLLQYMVTNLSIISSANGVLSRRIIAW